MRRFLEAGMESLPPTSEEQYTLLPFPSFE